MNIEEKIKKGIAIYCATLDLSADTVTTEFTAPNNRSGDWAMAVTFGNKKVDMEGPSLDEVVDAFVNQVTLFAQEKIRSDDARRKRLQFIFGQEV